MRKFIKECPDCGSINLNRNVERGEIVCKDCGLVVEDKVIDFWYMAIIAVQYFKKGEVWNSRTALQVIQSSLIKLLELLEDPKILLLETNKNVENFLSKDKMELIKRICPPYNKEVIKHSLIDMLDIFPDVFQKISKKYNYEYDKNLEEEIKPKLLKLLKKV